MPSPNALQRADVYASARLVSLVRLLLLALALAIFSQSEVFSNDLLEDIGGYALTTLVVASLISLGLVFTTNLVRNRLQLAFHLVFDLLWVGVVIYLSGGLAGGGSLLFFMVILTGNFLLPGLLPFVLPALSCIILAVIALLYSVGEHPFVDVPINNELVSGPQLIISLLINCGAIFLVDFLGQSLARRVLEQRIVLGELIEQLNEGVVSLDKELRVDYINESAQRFLGLDALVPGELLEDHLNDDRWLEVLDLVEAGEHGQSVDVSIREDLDLRFIVGDLRGRRGRIRGRTLVVIDQTVMNEMEVYLRRSERLSALGEMAAGIAHEVRNPLASLRGCVQEIQYGLKRADNKEDLVLADIAIKEVDRIARIVDQFLSLAKDNATRRVEIILSVLLDELRRGIELQDDLPKNLDVQVHCNDDGVVLFDRDHLRQILLNFISNALKALSIEKEPRLSISFELSSTPGRGTIIVKDNGIGMNDEELASLFTPFVSGMSQGTGLGMALAQRLAEQNDATIHVSSQKGVGTVLRLDIALAQH